MEMTYSSLGKCMSGTRRYLDVLESLRELFVNYPILAEMSSIRIASDPTGQVVLTVELCKAEPVVVAAGVVAWQRTLAKTTTWACRTSDGDELHIATTGRAPECDAMTVIVLAGPVPHDCRLDHGLEPGAAEELDGVALNDWLASETTNHWPFEPSVNNEPGAKP